MLAMALAVPTAMAQILDEERYTLLHIGVIFLPPFAAFAFLGFRALFFRRTSPFPALVGAAIGAFAAVAIPYGWAWHETRWPSGVGANIGLGLILIAVPFFLMCAMIAGWSIGLAASERD